ncbi:MAG: PEP-utilizing enzyme [Actinomycetota bacterium]|nr:PEP-utilizing enzyme [Actinomycetota bacterium]
MTGGEARELGRGEKAWDFGTVRGRWRRMEGPEDVLDLMDGEGLDDELGLVAVVRDAGATFLGPVFEDLVGVVCTGGTIRSHIGIVSREYRVPGIIGVTLTAEPADGILVELDATGPDGVVRTPPA